MKKVFVSFVAAAMSLLLAVGLTACGGPAPDDTPDDPAAHVHVWTQTGTTEATCGEAARTYYTCSCGASKSTRGEAATGAHSFGDGNVCEDCGYIDMSGLTEEAAIAAYGFYHDDKDHSGTYTTGDAVTFGSYPQSLVSDAETLALLDAEAGTLPTADSVGDWTSYRYYDAGKPSDYMCYKDVTVDGKLYRGVYMLAYRPYYSGLAASGDYSYIDDEGFETATVYWFAYAPITWTVLDYENGNLLLNSKYCLEGQPFQALYEGDRSGLVIPGTSTYVNDWEASSLRAFLNGDFYDLAFRTETERARIQTVTLDNSTTGYEAGAKYLADQNDTEDKVFLLSYQDILNEDYGYTSDAVRSRSFTSYATIQGMRTSSQGVTADGDPACYYMLRSAGSMLYVISGVSKMGTPSYIGNSINVGGTSSYDGYAINGDFGVLPSLYLNVGK